LNNIKLKKIIVNTIIAKLLHINPYNCLINNFFNAIPVTFNTFKHFYIIKISNLRYKYIFYKKKKNLLKLKKINNNFYCNLNFFKFVSKIKQSSSKNSNLKKFFRLNRKFNLKRNNNSTTQKLNLKKTDPLNKYYSIFLNIFYKFFKKYIYIINFNYFLKTKILKFNQLIFKIRNKFYFLKKTVYVHKLVKIVLASLIYKDSTILLPMVRDTFESIHYSKHRVYFSF